MAFIDLEILKVRRIIFFCSLSLTAGQAHQEFDLLTPTIIQNQSISGKCEHLQKDRDNKVFIKNSLDALLLRTRKLRKNVPEKKATLLRRLAYHESLIQQKRDRASRRLRRMEEGLLRQGCPLVRQPQ